MTIESSLERIAISAERSELLLGKILGALENLKLPEAAEQPVPVPTPAVTHSPAPQYVPAAAAVPPVPPVPFPVPPVPAAGPVCPITNPQELTAYAMEKWRTLGPVKGGMIQQVLADLGCATINQLPADKYAAFWQKVEVL